MLPNIQFNYLILTQQNQLIYLLASVHVINILNVREKPYEFCSDYRKGFVVL